MSSRNCGSEEYYRTHPSELTEQLYLAACRAVTSKCLLDLGITSIVNATLELPTVAYQKQDTIQIAVEDRVTAKLNIYFDLIADKIQQVHHGGGKILIYCRAGQSRSATLCIAYFMKYHNMTYEQAFQYVKCRRPIIHPNVGFVHQLKAFEERLKKKPEPKPLILQYADELCLENTIEYEAIDIPIPPIKHGKPLVSVHEPFQSCSDKYDIVSIQVCDSDSLKSRRPANPEKLGFSVQSGHPVASSFLPPRTVGAAKELDPSQSSQARGKQRKTAFTRLTKPNEIAVSFCNIPLDLHIASTNNDKFKLQIKPEHSTLAIAELLLHTAKSEGLAYQLVRDLPQTLAAGQPGKASSVLRVQSPPVTQLCVCVLDSTGSISYDTNNNVETSQDPPRLSRQPSVKSKTRSMLRFSGLSSYQVFPKLSEQQQSKTSNVKNSKLELNKIKANVINPVQAVLKLSDNLRYCSVSRVAPTILESTAQMNNGEEKFFTTQKTLTVMKLRYSICSLSTQSWQTPSNIPIFTVPIDCYHRLDFSFAPFETSSFASKIMQTPIGFCEVDVGNKMTVCREYPYYSTVHFTSALELFRVTENPKLDIQWFKLPQAVREDPVELIRKSSEARMAERRKKDSQLVIKWATERFHTDEFQDFLPNLTITRPVLYQAERILHNHQYEAFTLHYVVDYFKVDLIGRFYVPHYNPILLRKHCDPAFHPVAVTSDRPVLETSDVCSRLRSNHYKAVARRTLHSDCMLASVSSAGDVRNEGEYLENIPDEINDLSEMKSVLAEKTDSPRCKIWFEVFKRTLMKKRPTYPLISFTQPLHLPLNNQHLILEFVLAATQHSSHCQVANISTSLCSAQINTVHLIDKYSQSVDKTSKNIPAKTSYRRVAFEEYFKQVLSETSFEETKPMIPGHACSQVKAVSKVSFPNRLYCVQEETIHGLSGRLVKDTRAVSRVPFSIVTRLRPTSSQLVMVSLGVTVSLPEYKFVQDIEDQADLVIHRSTVSEVVHLTETDSFWFFSLEQSAVLNEETEADETAAPNNPSNFLLFLPDRKYATQIGQEQFPEENDNNNVDLNLLNSRAVRAEVIQEIKEQTEEKKVTFDTAADNEDSPKKQRVRTIYYGRDRSKSRTRLKDVETGAKMRRRDRSASCYSDAEVIKNLAKSVDEANNILMRRREDGAVSSSRYSDRAGLSPSPERYSCMSPRLETRSEERFARRSRDAMRNKEETERRERSRRAINTGDTSNLPNQPAPSSSPSSTTATSSAAAGDTSGKGLAGGIISFASNLISGNKGRREQADNRARGLLRKSARNFL